ncbi:MAG: hotdog domain-containing protein [Thermoleophilia bacterium]
MAGEGGGSYTLSILVMPTQANTLGVMHGGHMMSWMDMAAWVVATRAVEPGEEVFFKAIEEYVWHGPIRAGEVAHVTAALEAVGRTSLRAVPRTPRPRRSVRCATPSSPWSPLRTAAPSRCGCTPRRADTRIRRDPVRDVENSRVRDAVGSRGYDRGVLATDVLGIAERERVAALGELDARAQGELGQFFTPAVAAELIASIPRLPETGTLRVLDPGAGSGMLSAALVSRVLTERPCLSLDIIAIERDTAVTPHLRTTLAACERAGGGRVRAEAVEADFILDSTGLDSSLTIEARFDLVIENPPYGKLAVSSTHRRAMRVAGVDAPNLYAAFLVLSLSALRTGGQVVAITPRSFFNGPYFGAFRRYLLDAVALDRVHVFGSRSTVFADAGVLQENVIFSGTRGASPELVELSVSRDHTGSVSSRMVSYDDVVFPDDSNRFIRLATDADDTLVAEQVLSQPCSLADLCIQVSTGRVVEFRSRHALSDVEVPGAVPLIYPGNLRGGGVLWPRALRKPQWFQPIDERDRGMLLPEGWYSVVKRFSAKEERRRIVASVWSPVEHPGEVAFENHLNVFHANGHGLDKDVSNGLVIWLNSSVIDKFFRTFSGHTQVNATDLRTLRFPTLDTLRSLGGECAGSQSDVDSLVMKLIAA